MGQFVNHNYIFQKSLASARLFFVLGFFRFVGRQIGCKDAGHGIHGAGALDDHTGQTQQCCSGIRPQAGGYVQDDALVAVQIDAIAQLADQIIFLVHHATAMEQPFFAHVELAADGNTVVVIEHNLDVIKTADYIIDMGPEGGDGGGTVIAQGTPEEICQVEASYTGKFLKPYLNS